MKTHPYLRAYMAGITLPTFMMILALTVAATSRYLFGVQLPFERMLVFPLAIVPNLWGLWNITYLALRTRRYLPIAVHGALLAVIQASIGYSIARLIGFEIPALVLNGFPYVFPVVLIVFYLVWKHVVAFFNAMLGIG